MCQCKRFCTLLVHTGSQQSSMQFLSPVNHNYSGCVPITYIWLEEADDKYTYLAYIVLLIRLDNRNALLHNLPGNQLKRPKLVMNNAARLVMKLRKSCHITPVLIELHWLPIECRIKYKLLLLVFKCLQNLATSYLCSLLQPYTPS